jgi:hypothetical protein
MRWPLASPELEARLNGRFAPEAVVWTTYSINSIPVVRRVQLGAELRIKVSILVAEGPPAAGC